MAQIAHYVRKADGNWYTVSACEYLSDAGKGGRVETRTETVTVGSNRSAVVQRVIGMPGDVASWYRSFPLRSAHASTTRTPDATGNVVTTLRYEF